MKYEIKNIIIHLEKNQKASIKKELKKYGIYNEDINNIEYTKRSIDSRNKKSIKFVYNIIADISKKINSNNRNNIKEFENQKLVKRKPKKISGNVVVVGSGPAGLFSALRLAELGFNPIVLEKGESVEKRKKSVNDFLKAGVLKSDSNVQFGEGGAGTFSDGKLTTRIRSEYIEKVFQELVNAGADKDILIDYKPHIGTDVLIDVVKNIREKIIRLGGKVFFESELIDIEIKNDEVKRIKTKNGLDFDVEYLILATGHSSRDLYSLLDRKKVLMESKDFAVGFRIEHPQEIINKMQYGEYYNSNLLPPATYNFTHNNKEESRGIYTFCMCPGGEIINSSSSEGMNLVNGMSNSKRDSMYSNSAVVVSVNRSDYGNDLFSGIEFQQTIEKNAFNYSNEFSGLYQNLFDYLKNKKTKKLIKTNFKMNLNPINFNEFFPKFINRNLQKAFKYWSKNKYFVHPKANLIGPETRTSSPVRILRDELGCSINIKNLFPIGEGAGYAGGIVSSAVDGLKIIDKNFTME